MASVKRLACLLFVCVFALRVSAQLTASDVTNILARAVTRASAISSNSVITITVMDREGWVLGLWSVNGLSPAADVVGNAISKAGTAAFLSSKQNAFSSRSAGFIIQQHFPPPVNNKPPGPLVGVEFSNLPFSDINKFKAPGSTITFGSSPGNSIVPIPFTSLAGVPGGLPLYKSNILVGAIGVANAPAAFRHESKTAASAVVIPTFLPNLYAYNRDEDIAFAGQPALLRAQKSSARSVFIDGIRVPYVNSGTKLAPSVPLGTIGAQ